MNLIGAMVKRYCFWSLLWGCMLLIIQTVAWAQDKQGKTYQSLYLDALTVRDVQSGFDVQAFIERVRRDTTFYKAFKTLRILNYRMYNDIEIVTKEQETKATYNSSCRQEIKNHCRSMVVEQEKVSGDFFKKDRQYRYRTAGLYDHLFFTHGSICNENNIVAQTTFTGTTKYEEQLRILIFNPGRRITGIPGIGENVAIFEAPYFSKYNFYLSRTVYNGDSCYVFTAHPKPQYKNQVVINELKTWFRVSDFTIMARDYSLSFRTWIYDFDVEMKVKLKKTAQYLVPYEVAYKGSWHVFTKPREIARFTAIFTDFH